MSKNILVINSGSSSFKYALFNKRGAIASGIIERLGENMQSVKHSYNEQKKTNTIKLKSELFVPSHSHALKYALSLLEKHSNFTKSSLFGIGHRVVHGGPYLKSSCIIDKHVLQSIKDALHLAPLHNSANLLGIETAFNLFSKTKQVAVFDTAFHSTIPEHAYHYSIPYKYFKEFGVRKYGFHGTSHEYVMQEAAKFLKKPIDNFNAIICHLGAGSSMACIQNGKCIDTTMGMTPLEGLTMATRCGDIDPGVIFFLMKNCNLTSMQVEKILQNESGWYGLSGIKDGRELEDSCISGDQRSLLALEVIAHKIRKYLGAFYWNLSGRLDAIVFTAGIGENWSKLRSICLENSSVFGFVIDNDKNLQRHRDIADISTKSSKSKILIVPTNEEQNIANQTFQLIQEF